MNIRSAWRKMTDMRLLAWLVDERGGCTNGFDIGKNFKTEAGFKRPTDRYSGPLTLALNSLARAGWVTWQKRQPGDNFDTMIATVTAAGFLWRDYMKWDQFALNKMNAYDTHRYIRSLETALGPFAAIGLFIRQHPDRREGADKLLKALGSSALQADLAAEIVEPSGRGILWPWLPINVDVQKYRVLGHVHKSRKRKADREQKERNRGDGHEPPAKTKKVRHQTRSQVVRGQPEKQEPGDG